MIKQKNMPIQLITYTSDAKRASIVCPLPVECGSDAKLVEWFMNDQKRVCCSDHEQRST